MQCGVLIPQCNLLVRNSTELKQEITVPAIIDTGAAATIIPETYLLRLGNLLKTSPIRLRTTTNDVYVVDRYYVDLLIENSFDKPHHVVMSMPKKKYAIIGRDILNDYKVILDGNMNQWHFNCLQECAL